MKNNYKKLDVDVDETNVKDSDAISNTEIEKLNAELSKGVNIVMNQMTSFLSKFSEL